MPKTPINPPPRHRFLVLPTALSFRRQQRQIMPPADLPSPQPAIPADASGNSCLSDPLQDAQQPAISSDAGKGCRSTPDPTGKTGNICRPDPTLQSPSYRQYLPTGNICRPTPAPDSLRPAIIAAQHRLRTDSDRQNLSHNPIGRLIYTGIRWSIRGGRSLLKPRIVLPEAPDHSS